MHRSLSKELLSWKNHPLRKPLVLRGPRQVGKSFLVMTFGKTFAKCVTINFEKDPRAKALFNGTLDAKTLLSKIGAYTDSTITPGETLLFLDEIQECEEALLALRYFKEELPLLHVIAAGSLIDFALGRVGMPVGRVQFLYLHPMYFGEYLDAMREVQLHDYLLFHTVAAPLHEKLLDEYRHYTWLGGMPAVLDAWRLHHNAQYCQEIQDEILQSYRQDFSKYARQHQLVHLTRVFDHMGMQLGEKFKYSKVDPDVRSAVLKEALHLLVQAGVVNEAGRGNL